MDATPGPEPEAQATPVADASGADGTDSGAPRSPQAVAEAIELDVIARGWPVGSLYATQVELEERYGVSRTVLREATGILVDHQVLEPRRGRGGGLVVTAPDQSRAVRSIALLLSYQQLTVEELEDVRPPIELLAVRLAAQRVDDASADRIRAVVEAERRDPYGIGMRQEMPNMHVVLAEVSGNRALQLFAEIITSVSRQGASAARRRQDGERLVEEHAEIAGAVLAGDPEAAERLMAAHLQSLRELGF
ncbi:FCD domain-containing protein [Pseudonocardia sp. NPDC049154]|uniref:FadR/GntR family transcriptional regulator n=1 Tax=Pseudonocardia sp. NPDC049154 TaxID=3155501 RepID=UPI00340C3DE5